MNFFKYLINQYFQYSNFLYCQTYIFYKKSLKNLIKLNLKIFSSKYSKFLILSKKSFAKLIFIIKNTYNVLKYNAISPNKNKLYIFYSNNNQTN